MLELKDWETVDDPATVCQFVEELVADIKSARKSIKIYAGELHRQIFSDPEVLEAFRAAKKRGVEIQILLSPVLSAWVSRSGRYAPILELKREGVVEMRLRQNRGGTAHFRLIDDKRAVVEEYHEPLGSLYKRNIDHQPSNVSELVDIFNKDWEKKEKEDFTDEPLLLTPYEIRRIKEKAEEAGKRYDDLTKDEIRKLYNQVKKEEEKKKQREREEIWKLRAVFEKFV